MLIHFMRQRCLLFLLLIGLGALGASVIRAGDDDALAQIVAPTHATIAAAVTLDGNRLTDGRIFFHLPKGQFAGAIIEAGKCQLDCVPLGRHKVSFETEELPGYYRSLEQASLSVEVVPGKNVFDFELVSK